MDPTLLSFLSSLPVRGKVGDVVFKQYKYGTVVTKCPDMSNAGCSRSQRKARTLFQQAVALAQQAIADTEQKRYFGKMKGKGSAYNKAVSHYMRELKEQP